MKYKILGFLLSIFLSINLAAQSGGRGVYAFLDIPSSAREVAMGGSIYPVWDEDVALVATHPSLISENMHNYLTVGYNNYFADINAGFVTYIRNFKKIGPLAFSLKYLNYGEFTRADFTGVKLGSFHAGDYALIVGWSKKLSEHWNAGINLKNIYSAYDSYNSYGIATDIAFTYHKSNGLAATFVGKNIGVQIDPYIKGNREKLPFQLLAGISKKMEKAPFRLMLVAQQLQRYDLTYLDPYDRNNYDPLTGELKKKSTLDEHADMFMRHIIMGSEVLLSKNFHIRIAYNYLRRRELAVVSKTATVGFSYGFGIKVKKFHLSYSRSAFHLHGSPNQFTITTNLNEFSS